MHVSLATGSYVWFNVTLQNLNTNYDPQSFCFMSSSIQPHSLIHYHLPIVAIQNEILDNCVCAGHIGTHTTA